MSGKKGRKHTNSVGDFLSKVDNIPFNQNDCRIWPYGKDKDGYGYYSINKKMYRTHRFLYHLIHGKFNPKLVVMHFCDNRACCNIKHLTLGTISENTMDMVKKTRNVQGSSVGTSVLNEKQVLEIRSKYPEKSGIELANEYGVCKQTIYNAINEITFVNASHVNERYQPVNKPIRVVL
jgi:hypothetical protein